MEYKDWRIQELTGYVPKTTFYMDFSIADAHGADAVLDTYKRAFEAWKGDYEYLTELSLALNWKIWEHFESKNAVLSALYDKLWREVDEYAMNNLHGDELDYYCRITD